MNPTLINLNRCFRGLLLLCILPVVNGTAAKGELPPEEEAWLEAEIDTSQVSEGELRFLPRPPDKGTLHIQNRISISPASSRNGWVRLVQCHHNLAPLPDTQIVYRYKAMEGLAIESTNGIGKAWVEAQSVQMEDIERNASICVSAEVQIFRPHHESGYSLINGPYHLRFLDGYYPLRVTLAIDYPDGLFTVSGMTPEPQPGLTLVQEPGRVLIDAHFEGMLYTELRFQPRE